MEEMIQHYKAEIEALELELSQCNKVIKNQQAEIDRYKCVNKLLERDIADRDKKLESKVEEVYADFMKDYHIMWEELDGAYDENGELRKEKLRLKKKLAERYGVEVE